MLRAATALCNFTMLRYSQVQNTAMLRRSPDLDEDLLFPAAEKAPRIVPHKHLPLTRHRHSALHCTPPRTLQRRPSVQNYAPQRRSLHSPTLTLETRDRNPTARLTARRSSRLSDSFRVMIMTCHSSKARNKNPRPTWPKDPQSSISSTFVGVSSFWSWFFALSFPV